MWKTVAHINLASLTLIFIWEYTLQAVETIIIIKKEETYNYTTHMHSIISCGTCAMVCEMEYGLIFMLILALCLSFSHRCWCGSVTCKFREIWSSSRHRARFWHCEMRHMPWLFFLSKSIHLKIKFSCSTNFVELVICLNTTMWATASTWFIHFAVLLL